MQEDKVEQFEVAQKTLMNIQQAVEQLSKDPSKLIKVSQFIKEMLVSYHLSIIISMHHSESLKKFLESWTSLQKKYKRSQMEVVFMIFSLGWQFLLKMDSKFFGKVYKTLKISKEELRSYKEFLKQPFDSFQKYQFLIKSFFELKTSTELETYALGLKLNQFINNHLKRIYPSNAFEEVIVTWLKKEATLLQTQILEEKKYQNKALCCKLHFQRYKAYEIDANYDHYNIVTKDRVEFGLQKDFFLRQGDNIRKNIVYYMNHKGGYLYLGVLVTKQGKEEGISGIPMNDRSMLQVLKDIEKNVIVQIFPTDGELDDENEDQEKERIQQFLKNKEYDFKQLIDNKFLTFQLSKLIQLQFLNVYDKTNLLYSRNQKGELLYSMRFKIKMGDPAEIYFILNQKQLPEAYLQKQKPLLMIDYYNQVYKRLKDKANHKLETKDPNSHPLCLQNLKLELKEQSQGSNNDDEEDDE